MKYALLDTGLRNFSGKKKFIILDDGTIIFGQVVVHRDLWSKYCRTKSLDATCAPRLIGAGEYAAKKKIFINSWESSGYHLETPEDLRPSILDFFAAHVTELAMIDESYIP